MLLEVHPTHPQKRLIERIVSVLEKDGVIVYPTDTCYAMGCSIFSKKAVERIYKIKRYPLNKALSIVCTNISDISNYAKISDMAYRNMKRLLPGPYTFILSATKEVPKTISEGKRREVGIRIPNNVICQAIVEALGHPLLSAGAGHEDELDTATIPYMIEDEIGKQVDIVIDGGVLANEFSTVVSLVDDEVTIIRQGKGKVDFLG